MSCNPELNLLYWFFLSIFRWGVHVEREDDALFEKIISFDVLYIWLCWGTHERNINKISLNTIAVLKTADKSHFRLQLKPAKHESRKNYNACTASTSSSLALGWATVFSPIINFYFKKPVQI